MMVLEDFEVTR